MTVQEFVDKYNGFNNDTLKTNLCNEVMKNEYIPYTVKMAACNSIVKATTHNTISIDGKDKTYFYMDTPNRYLLFRIRLLRDYTTIEFSKEPIDQIKEYELLDKYGLNEILTAQIDEREYASYKMLLDMFVDDYTMNENSLVNFIEGKLEALGIATNTILDALEEFIKSPEVATALSALSNENKDTTNES